MLLISESIYVVGGGGQGAGHREKRGREVYGRRKKRGGKRDSQGGGKWEKKGKITQHRATFRNGKMQRGGSQQVQGGNQN